MKILHTVEFYSPSVGGAQEVVRQISEQLVKRGHDVVVATTKLAERKEKMIGGVRVEEFAISGNQVNGFCGETSRYQEFLLDGQFDVMMNYAAQQWASDLVFPILDRITYRKVFAPCGFSGLYDYRYAGYFSGLPGILKRYDHLIFHSDSYRDIKFARKHDLNYLTVIPNGAAAHEFDCVDQTFRSRYLIPENIPLLLTVGSHTGIKGHALAIEAFRKAQIGRAILVVIGNTIGTGNCLPDCRRRALLTKVLSFGKKQVFLLNTPREDVVAAYQAADLFVFGSNIECSPIVFFEAMASKTPFVTVECGNAAEIVMWGGGGITIPTKKLANGYVKTNPASMARAMEKLINHPLERVQLAEAGYHAWKERFTWEKIAVNYERLYQTLLGENPNNF